MLSLKCPGQEEDDGRRDESESDHGGDSDAHHEGLRYKLLTVLTPVPPVLTHPASGMRREQVQNGITLLKVTVNSETFSGTGER